MKDKLTQVHFVLVYRTDESFVVEFDKVFVFV